VRAPKTLITATNSSDQQVDLTINLMLAARPLSQENQAIHIHGANFTNWRR
jgi:hypothetical protein